MWQLYKKALTQAPGAQFWLGSGREGHQLSVLAISVSNVE